MKSLTPYLSLVLSALLIASPLAAETLPQLRVLESDGPAVTAGSRSVKGITIEVTDPAGAAIEDAAVSVRLPDNGPTGTFADGTHSAVVYTDKSGRAHITGIQWNSTPGVVPVRVTATKGTAHAGTLLEATLTATPATAPVVPNDSVDVPGASQVLAQLPSPPPAPTDTIPVAKSGASAPAPQQPGTPAVRPVLPGTPSAQVQQPSVSITSTGASDKSHSGKTKWIIAALVAGGAAGAMMALKGGKGSASAAAPPSLSIGTPSISVGAP